MKKTDLYRYDLLEKALDNYVNGLAKPGVARRSLKKLKMSVLAAAWIDHCLWDPEVDKEQAMAWAWEDMSIAFRGYGESSSTGVVIELWTMVGKERWPEFRKAVDKGLSDAERRTKKTVRRRYMSKHLKLRSRSPDDGFELPCAVPTGGRVLRNWALENGMDPDEVEASLQEMEELERLGFLKLDPEVGGKGKRPEPPVKPGRPVLTLLPGGVSQD